MKTVFDTYKVQQGTLRKIFHYDMFEDLEAVRPLQSMVSKCTYLFPRLHNALPLLVK